MPRKSSAKLYVVLTGAQLVLDSFAGSLSQTLGFYDRNGTRAFDDPEFVLELRRQIFKARAALDLAEKYLNKSVGTKPKALFARKPSLDKAIFPPGPLKDIEGCTDWPEDGSDDPQTDQEE